MCADKVLSARLLYSYDSCRRADSTVPDSYNNCTQIEDKQPQFIKVLDLLDTYVINNNGLVCNDIVSIHRKAIDACSFSWILS